MAKMRGELAEAIRAGNVDAVRVLLEKYCSKDNPAYFEKYRDNILKKAAGLARSIKVRNHELEEAQMILEVIDHVRNLRASQVPSSTTHVKKSNDRII